MYLYDRTVEPGGVVEVWRGGGLLQAQHTLSPYLHILTCPVHVFEDPNPVLFGIGSNPDPVKAACFKHSTLSARTYTIDFDLPLTYL